MPMTLIFDVSVTVVAWQVANTGAVLYVHNQTKVFMIKREARLMRFVLAISFLGWLHVEKEKGKGHNV